MYVNKVIYLHQVTECLAKNPSATLCVSRNINTPVLTSMFT